MKHLNIQIHGQMQGVTFRFSSRQEAEKLNITGFIRNEPDGAVYIETEGEEKNLEKFLDWCKKGPKFAKVTNVEIGPGELQNYQHFLIK